MTGNEKITPCLWFDRNAEEAVNHYMSIFKNSRIISLSRYGETGPLPRGTALTVTFEFEGQRFQALNGGPYFKFSVSCGTQAELDGWQSCPVFVSAPHLSLCRSRSGMLILLILIVPAKQIAGMLVYVTWLALSEIAASRFAWPHRRAWVG